MFKKSWLAVVGVLVAGGANAGTPTIASRDVAVDAIVPEAATFGFLGADGSLQAAYSDGQNIHAVNLDSGREICSTYPSIQAQDGTKPSLGAPRVVNGQVTVLVQLPSFVSGGEQNYESFLYEICSGRTLDLGQSLGIRDVSEVLAGRYVFIDRWMAPAGPGPFAADFLFVDLSAFQITASLKGLSASTPEARLNAAGFPVLLLLGMDPLTLWNPLRGTKTDVAAQNFSGDWYPQHTTIAGGVSALAIEARDNSIQILELDPLFEGKVDQLASVPGAAQFPFATAQGLFSVDASGLNQLQLVDGGFTVEKSYPIAVTDCQPMATTLLLPGGHLGTALSCVFQDGTFGPPQGIKIWDLDAGKEVSSFSIPHFFGGSEGSVLTSAATTGAATQYLVYGDDTNVAQIVNLGSESLLTMPGSTFFSVSEDTLGLLSQPTESGTASPILYKSEQTDTANGISDSLCVAPDWLSVSQASCASVNATAQDLGLSWPTIVRSGGTVAIATATSTGYQVLTISP